MNKLYLSLALLICAMTSQAQVVFSENFNGGNALSTWTLINSDGLTPDANVAQFTDAWIIQEDFDTTGVGDSCAMSTSWYSPAGTASDWLITPQITLTANNILTFEEKAQDINFPDGYELRISTTTPTIAGFMANPALLTVAAATNPASQRSIDLQAAGYSLQNIYLAWHNNSTDQFILVIDNVLIQTAASYDIAMTATDDEYTIRPLSQVTPIGTAGDITNIGANPVTNVTMTVNVYDGAMASVYNASATPTPVLTASSTASFTVPGYTPATADNYTIEYICSMTETDGDMTNDTVRYNYVVSDSVFARDDNQVTGTLGIGAGNGGDLGQYFSLNAADNLSSVSIFIGNTTGNMVGQPLYARIWDMSAGLPNAVIGTTDTIIMDTTSNTLWTLNVNGGPLSLLPGDYTITVAETDSNVTVGTATTKFTTTTTMVTWPTSPMLPWAHNEDFGFNNTYVLRANFAPFICSNPTAMWSEVANGSLTHDFTDGSSTTGTASYMWDFGDGNTSTLQNPSHTYAAPGSYTVCMIVADSCGADTSCQLVVATNCPDPTPSFTFVDNALQVTFTDASTSTGTSAYFWDFGDGNTSTLQNPMHTYAAAGSYTVCLTVTDSCASDSVCQTVTVTQCTTTAAYTFSNTGADVTFTDASATNGGESYLWDFGDGNTSTVQNPSHTYTANGNYTVCLTVSDSCGTDSTCQTITILGIGVDEVETSVFGIYPNPTNDQVSVTNINGLKINSITVLDINGRQVKYVDIKANQIIHVIDLSAYESGLYFFNINGDDWTTTIKVVKK